MAERELKKMNRSELIEIIYALQREEQNLRKRVDELEGQLAERTIILESSGSIAEASLRLNKIFEDAQAAADQYLRSVRAMAEDGRLAEKTGDPFGETKGKRIEEPIGEPSKKLSEEMETDDQNRESGLNSPAESIGWEEQDEDFEIEFIEIEEFDE